MNIVRNRTKRKMHFSSSVIPCTRYHQVSGINSGVSFILLLNIKVNEISVRGNCFKLSMNYQYLKTLGSGAYGVVIAARDYDLNTDVAIKKISNVGFNFYNISLGI